MRADTPTRCPEDAAPVVPVKPLAKRPAKTRGGAPVVSKAKRPPDADLVITKVGGELTVLIRGTPVAAENGAAARVIGILEQDYPTAFNAFDRATALSPSSATLVGL